MQHTQLPLGLSLQDEVTFENFYLGKNKEIVSTLRKTAAGEGERVIYLCGMRGQGRSHLLQAACHAAQQYHLQALYLPLGNRSTLQSEFLNHIENLNLICLDDIHTIAGKPEWEEAIFHLYNRIYDAGGRIIIAANELPKAIHVQLADLVSRLSWGVVYQLQPLSDEEKISVLMMRANRRGINLSEEVGKYLLTHCPRHMGTLFAALDVLDKASLAAQRRLTIPFVKEILEI